MSWNKCMPAEVWEPGKTSDIVAYIQPTVSAVAFAKGHDGNAHGICIIAEDKGVALHQTWITLALKDVLLSKNRVVVGSFHWLVHFAQIMSCSNGTICLWVNKNLACSIWYHRHGSRVQVSIMLNFLLAGGNVTSGDAIRLHAVVGLGTKLKFDVELAFGVLATNRTRKSPCNPVEDRWIKEDQDAWKNWWLHLDYWLHRHLSSGIFPM
jgi:hypothetical protein